MQWVFVLILCCASAVMSLRTNATPRKDEVEDRRDDRTNQNNSVTEERTVTSEQRKDGIHHTVTITKKIRYPYTVHVEKRIPKIIEVPVDKPFNVYVPKPYPVIVEKKVPYEIKVPVPQPYTVEKKVPYPVKVLVDKPYTLHVPKPYPVEVEKKFEFTVEKRVPVEVKVPVERPYPVHVIVEKEVKFPVEKKIPFPVKVPYDKPIPIEVKKHVPVHVDKPVQYTIEKVATYPVNVPFRIPIKVHYPEGSSMEELYFETPSIPEVQNHEWSEAMASAVQATRFEQHNVRSPIRQGYSLSSHRGQYPRNIKTNAFFSNDAHVRQNQKHNSNPLPSTRQQPSYEVNEAQPPSEHLKATPFFSKPDSEVIVPQLVIGNAPQQSTNMLLSQAAIASIVSNGNNDFDASKSVATPDKTQYHTPTNGRPLFTISHAVQHDSPSRPQQLLHQVEHNSGNVRLQQVNLGQSHQAAANIEASNSFYALDSQSSPLVSQFPSATYHKPPSKNNTVSLPEWIGTRKGLRTPPVSNLSNVAQQTSSTLPFTVSRQPLNPSQDHRSPPRPSLPSLMRGSQSSISNPSSNDPISSSFVGSKTFLGDQQLVYTSSVQHNQTPN